MAELPVDEVEIVPKKIVGYGEVELSRNETKEYEAELWEAFAYWVGKR